MTNTIPKLVGIIGVLAATVASHHPGFAANDHPMVTSDDIKWEAAPPVLPKGAQVAVLYGDCCRSWRTSADDLDCYFRAESKDR